MKPPYLRIKSYLELCKLKISLFAAFSAVTGYLLSGQIAGLKMLIMITGVFLVACGACGLNQHQEMQIDALMPRTKARPLPSGRITLRHALYFSLALISSGSFLLFAAGGGVTLLLGLFALLWYNAVYTPLKRKSAFAAVPGALIGALPPAMGWTSGGGTLTDPRLASLCFFFFMWQTPHFWLLLLDRGKEYEAAGLPSLTGIFGESQLRRIIFAWMNAAAVSALLIIRSGPVRNAGVTISLSVLSFWLIWNGAGLLRKEGRCGDYVFAFRRMNIFVLISMLLLSLDRLFFSSAAF
jgi:protoheme IX farnesyltransferase